MALDLNKPVQTRNGHPARIVCTDVAGSSMPVIAVVLLSPECEDTLRYTTEGRCKGVDKKYDLINVPPPKKTVQVEVRLTLDAYGAISPWIRVLNQHPEKQWGPLADNHIASTTITMEYEVQE